MSNEYNRGVIFGFLFTFISLSPFFLFDDLPDGVVLLNYAFHDNDTYEFNVNYMSIDNQSWLSLDYSDHYVMQKDLIEKYNLKKGDKVYLKVFSVQRGE